MGVPLFVVFLVLVGVAVVTVLVMVYLTRGYRKTVHHLEQEQQLELLATSNAYMLSTFQQEVGSLRESGLEYNYTSLEVVGELGEGAFGRVFKATAPGLEPELTEQCEFVAVKTLKEDADSDVLSMFLAEVKTSAQFQHPHVIRLIGMCTESNHMCMIFEYMDLGSLNDILRRSDPANPSYSSTDEGTTISPDRFLSCCVQLAQGLAYLASLKFVHRDIASRNCLVNSRFVVKIADFGMSREISNDYYRIGSAKACLPVRWMPPEALLYGKFTVKSDVWSYGVLMWEIYSYACQPFGGVSNYEVIDRIKAGQILDCPDLCPASVFDIMKTCWTKVPQRRPTMARILQRIGHLLRSNSMDFMDDYTTMGSAEGYLNLAFGTTVKEEELEEKRRVDSLIQQAEQREMGEEGEQEKGGGEMGDESGRGEQEKEGGRDEAGKGEQEKEGGRGEQEKEGERDEASKGEQEKEEGGETGLEAGKREDKEGGRGEMGDEASKGEQEETGKGEKESERRDVIEGEQESNFGDEGGKREDDSEGQTKSEEPK